MQLHWVQPQQGRSQRTLEALLDSAETLLAGGSSFERMSVAQVARSAGVSVGAFYGRFRSKADLLRALYTRYAEQSRATLEVWVGPQIDSSSLGELVGALCRFLVHDYRQRAGLRSAFALAVPSDPVLHGLAGDLTRHTITAFTALLAARPDEWVGDDPALAADMVHRILFGILEQDLHFDTAFCDPVGDDVLAAQLTRAVLGYLGSP